MNRLIEVTNKQIPDALRKHLKEAKDDLTMKYLVPCGPMYCFTCKVISGENYFN